ncbi:hypothetical protein [Sphingomonas faeni]|uniref:hypothetical protein n=1 Tax=Sphingomonas faeni TaxID=185950 RepID=UPI0024139736|nr:hypothetical protein [Sphingomonas faeni]
MAVQLKAPPRAAPAVAKPAAQVTNSSGGSGIDVKAMFDRTMRRYPNTMARLAE